MKTFQEWLNKKDNVINESDDQILQDIDINKELDLKSLIKLEKSLNSHSYEIDDNNWQSLYKVFKDYFGKEDHHEQARYIGNALNNAATTGDMDSLNALQEQLK